jgi:PmbA protein
MGTTGEIQAAQARAAEGLRAALTSTAGAHDWQIELRAEEEAQLYLIGSQVENQRTVTTQSARLTLYNDHAPRGGGAGLARGSASLTLYGGEAAEATAVGARLQEAVAIAELTDNPPFALPEQPAGGFPTVPVDDPALGGSLAAAMEAAHAQLDAASGDLRDVRLASAELYLTRGRRALENSRGLHGAYDATRVYLDLVLVASDGISEAEFHAVLERRRLEDLNLGAAVAAYATFARDSLRAVAPSTHRGPVLLTGGALSGLFTPLVAHSSAQAAFQGISRLKVGEAVTTQPPRGDRIALSGDRVRPFGMSSAPFDAQGVPAGRVDVITDGQLRGLWADARYGAYQGVPVTGDFGNVALGAGTTPLAALRAAEGGPVYEIVEFSWLRPDAITGAFVSEIKLGYRHEPGGVAVPIRGGSLTGDLFSALAGARLSSELFSNGAYYGPAGIRFDDLTISGE